MLLPRFSTSHVRLGRIWQVNSLRRSLEEYSLSGLCFYVLDHWLVVAAPKLLVVLVGLGVGSPPENWRSDVIPHVWKLGTILLQIFQGKSKKKNMSVLQKIGHLLNLEKSKSFKTVWISFHKQRNYSYYSRIFCVDSGILIQLTWDF